MHPTYTISYESAEQKPYPCASDIQIVFLKFILITKPIRKSSAYKLEIINIIQCQLFSAEKIIFITFRLISFHTET